MAFPIPSRVVFGVFIASNINLIETLKQHFGAGKARARAAFERRNVNCCLWSSFWHLSGSSRPDENLDPVKCQQKTFAFHLVASLRKRAYSNLLFIDEPARVERLVVCECVKGSGLA